MDKEEILNKKEIAKRLEISNKKLWKSLSDADKEFVVNEWYKESDIEVVGLRSVINHNRDLNSNFGFVLMGIGIGIISDFFVDALKGLGVLKSTSNVAVLILCIFAFILILHAFKRLSGDQLRVYGVLEHLLKRKK